jgi:hypothetical protein
VRLIVGLYALALVSVPTSGCDRGVGPDTRPVEVHGLPTCPSKSSYVRPLVVRFDRDRVLFEEAFSTQTRVDTPSVPTLTVPRVRMKATIRVGLCARTSVATWDCSAATWLTSTTVSLDARAAVAVVTVPAASALCTHGSP